MGGQKLFSGELIKDVVTQSKAASLLLELQQRSIEFNCIIEKHQNISGRKSGSVIAPAVSTSLKSANGIATSAAAP
ncbi:hypothetical protein QVD17_03628 [Tagetes erecta]|uniref:Uncharacterized protein n=1 Tax=Tagetes erecta TaxID=13708 RepID=A0AAD8LBN0_TARER|nr:hypothetical protein QVD17_03628 [Tagetes erecta]